MKDILLAICFMLNVATAMAQGAIVGQLFDANTQKSIPEGPEAYSVVLTADSAYVPEAVAKVYSKKEGQTHRTYIELSAPSKKGEYILALEVVGYEVIYCNFTLADPKAKIDWGKIFLKPLPNDNTIALGEAVVSTPKLKFYFDNDTLVYNASSYFRQAGARLSQILEQMPGLEIKPDGAIFAQGKPVNTLLLNGKDFFNRDRVTLLANLPAYAVKQVRVYEETEGKTEGFEREKHHRGHIVDIILKPDFRAAVFGNTDLGYGTDGHYYAKLFGMAYSPNYRVSAYAITNDINRNEQLQLDGTAQDVDDGLGQKKRHKLGLAYNYDNYKKRYALGGDLSFLWTDTYRHVDQAQQRFLSSGDTYSYVKTDVNTKNFAFNTQHEFNPWANTPYSLTIRPQLSYAYTDNRLDNFTGTTHYDVQPLAQDWLDSLTSRHYSSLFERYGINRVWYRQKADSRVLTSGLNIEKANLLLGEGYVWSAKAEWNYYTHRNHNYAQRQVDYVALPSLNSWQNQYAREEAWRNHIGLSTRLGLVVGPGMLGVSYGLSHVGYDTDHGLFALDALNGWQRGDNAPLGLLPSQTAMLSVIDNNNSYGYFEQQWLHNIGLEYVYERKASSDSILRHASKLASLSTTSVSLSTSHKWPIIKNFTATTIYQARV